VIGESNYPILMTPYPITSCPLSEIHGANLQRKRRGRKKDGAASLIGARESLHLSPCLQTVFASRLDSRDEKPYRASPLRRTHVHTRAARPNLPSIAAVVPYQNAAFVPLAHSGCEGKERGRVHKAGSYLRAWRGRVPRGITPPGISVHSRCPARWFASADAGHGPNAGAYRLSLINVRIASPSCRYLPPNAFTAPPLRSRHRRNVVSTPGLARGRSPSCIVSRPVSYRYRRR